MDNIQQIADAVQKGLQLERTDYRNDSKRPAIPEPKQILNLTSRLLSAILCNQ